jgi:phosphatidyl-myo-inositol dimannoside synthase
MHVCLISYEFPPHGGGEASYTRSLAEAFARGGDEVTLVVPKAPDMARIKSERVRVLTTEAGGPIREARFLAGAERALDHLVRTRKPDIVHVTFDYPTFFLHVRRPGVPCVATVHHLHLPEAMSMAETRRGLAERVPTLLKASIINSLEGMLLRQCDATLAVSRFSASTVERFLAIEPGRLRVVANGIDPSPFERGSGEAFRRRFPAAVGKLVLYVGRLTQSKGVDVLIEGFAKVKKEEPDVSLIIVGSGDSRYRSYLSGRAESLGVSGSVVFTGRIPDELLPHAYAACELTVLPSYMEGFGLSVLESMASARPSVATRVGGVPEVMVDGETGLLVPPGDAERLAEAMGTLLADPALANRMGEAGRDLAKRQFTVEKMAEGTMAVYRESIRRRGAAI